MSMIDEKKISSDNDFNKNAAKHNALTLIRHIPLFSQLSDDELKHRVLRIEATKEKRVL